MAYHPLQTIKKYGKKIKLIMLKINTKAPTFNLNSTNGNTYSLKSSVGKYVVLYFYPKDDTPGCTIETNDFNKLLTKFKKLNCQIYGISKDDMKSHNKFKEKYKIKFDLLADNEIKIVKNYKVWAKKYLWAGSLWVLLEVLF